LDVEQTAMVKMVAALERDGFGEVQRSRANDRSRVSLAKSWT